jgi:hypothetical protein
MDKEASKILFSEPYIKIEFDSDNSRLYVDWIGYINRDYLVDGCAKVLLALKEVRCYKILNDNTHVTGAWPETPEWIRDEYIDDLIAHGCKYLAWVLSPNLETQHTVLESLQFTGKDIQILLFIDMETALAWLNEV